MKKIIYESINKSLKKGWGVSKQTSAGGLFFYPSYDRRTVYDREELYRLTKQGFYLDEDPGMLALNILMNATEPKEKSGKK